MRAFDRSVEINLALWNMAGSAEIIVELRSAGVILARSEVDIIMARATSYTRWLRQVCRRLRSLGGLRVACFTVPYIGRVDHRRPVGDGLVESNDLVWLSGLHARQAQTHVNLVNHDFQI